MQIIEGDIERNTHLRERHTQIREVGTQRRIEETHTDKRGRHRKRDLEIR